MKTISIFLLLSTGTFSNDPDVKAIKTELLIPTVYITAPTSDDYLKAFEDTSSEPSTILIGMINDIVSSIEEKNFLTKISDFDFFDNMFLGAVLETNVF